MYPTIQSKAPAALEMVSTPLVVSQDSTIVVRRTFIEEVDTPGDAPGALRTRCCSDSALLRVGEPRHPWHTESEAACAASDAEEAEPELCGLSDGTADTTLDRPDDAADDAPARGAGALLCYAAHLPEGRRTCQRGGAPARGAGADDAADDAPARGTLLCYAHLPEGPAPPAGPRAPIWASAVPAPAVGFDRLLQENRRLALENQMLRESTRLAEGQGHPAQRSAVAAAGRQAVALGAWAVPMGMVALPVLACAAQPAAMPPDGGALGATRRGGRGGSTRLAQAPAQGAGARGPPPAAPERERTTVMVRNLPNNYSRVMLLELLDRLGFSGRFDFLYLPIDFKSGSSLGYSFVNLVDPGAVRAFWSRLDGFSDWDLPSRKVCSVGWTGPHQGLDAHIERYRNSPVMHPTVPDAYKPAVFEGGVRVPFPGPTRATPAPRVRNRPPGDPEAPRGWPAGA
ncbi:unnamed protein product [Prorocentrum cordatum]|uniref:Mei2-like C-terminal RNA recognition motif domain-containing protein n=1 Tax=Prorocentrum cordatum TaxID=2364126 RepID=A0ABN9V1G2_9DINO|nr:unnamed protein product [Polarella glacialis]